MLIWFGLFIVAAVCIGVGIGVGAHLENNGSNDNKEKLETYINVNKKKIFLIHKKDDGSKEIIHPMFEPIKKKGPAFKNGKLIKGSPGNNRKVSVYDDQINELSTNSSCVLFFFGNCLKIFNRIFVRA